ncbi:FtsX-like permease family protein [Flavihumibacter sp. R14]|nr:FtsX-like permease family protein [Flavihumibacter soli]
MKNRLFAFINIFGLALSLSVCMMVMIRLYDDLSYDRFHPLADRTFRILSKISKPDGDQWKLASSPLPLKNALSLHNDAIESSVRIYPAINHKAATTTKELSIRGAFTEPSFFTVFGFTLSSGNKTTALHQPNGVVLSSSLANRFFGKNDAIGQILTIEKLGIFEVTGVLTEIPGKTHLDFDAYFSSAALPQLEKTKLLPARLGNWDTFEHSYNYVVLRKSVSEETLTKLLDQEAAALNKESKDVRIGFLFQPLSGITPGDSSVYNGIGRGTSWAKVYTEAGVAFIILLAACFNYTSLTVARTLSRAREVGIRKVMGASRAQIFLQYIIESVILALFALLFAYILLQEILRFKPFNDSYEFIPAVDITPGLLISFLLFTLATGIMAGAFPAWILSAFKPVRVLRNVATEKVFGNISLQKGLLIFQFSLSLLIIIFLSTFYRQFSFMSTINYGFRNENIISIPLTGSSEVLISKISGVSGVTAVSRTSENFGKYNSGTAPVISDKRSRNKINVDYYFTDKAVIPVMNLKLLAGNNFLQNGTPEKEKEILINEQAVKLLGFGNNDQAIGKVVWLNDSVPLQISGVLNDFYYQGVANRIGPMMLRNNSDNYNYLNVQVNAADKVRLVKEIEKVWKKLYPHDAFSYFWLDKRLAEMQNQTATISLLGFLSFMTIAIASLGLLGLVIYTVETRRKEIGIRKVLGASVKQLMFILSQGFFKLLLIAGLIAIPLAYTLCFFFLQNFPNRVQVGAGSLALCFMFLLAIGTLTIISNIYRTATENPVNSLRDE